MNTMTNQLGLLNLDFSDNMSIIEEDEERKDAMGDLPDWDTLSLRDFTFGHYYRTYKGSRAKWHIIESKLGDGTWTGRPTWRGDALTDSTDTLAAREVTMLKFLQPEEVQELHYHILKLIEAGDSPNKAADASLHLVYEHARKTRWMKMHSYTPQVERLLYATSSRYNVNHFYATCKEMVEEQATRDEFITRVGNMLLIKVYGRPWRYFNQMYWNVRFNWDIEVPNEIMTACAVRYAHAISFNNVVHSP